MVSQFKTSRLVAFIAFGLGVALIACGLVLPRVLPVVKEVPLNVQASTLTLRDDAAHMGQVYIKPTNPDVKQDDILTGPVVRQFKAGLSEPITHGNVSARLGVTTSRPDIHDDMYSLLDAQVWSFMVNRDSGEFAGDVKVADTPVTPPTPVDAQGYWLKFPRGVEEEIYPFFDPVLRRAEPAVASGTRMVQDESGNDVELKVYRQEIPATSLQELYQGVRNVVTIEPQGSVAAEDAESSEGGVARQAYLVRTGWREIAVEQKSGMIVAVDEYTRDFYSTPEGEDVQLLLEFNGHTDEEQQKALLAQAQNLAEERNTDVWGLALIVVGAIVAAVSIVVLLLTRLRRRVV